MEITVQHNAHLQNAGIYFTIVFRCCKIKRYMTELLNKMEIVA